MLGIHSQVLMLALEALYLRSHLPGTRSPFDIITFISTYTCRYVCETKTKPDAYAGFLPQRLWHIFADISFSVHRISLDTGFHCIQVLSKVGKIKYEPRWTQIPFCRLPTASPTRCRCRRYPVYCLRGGECSGEWGERKNRLGLRCWIQALARGILTF